MTFIVPDPHPGRCQNYRTVNHGNGQAEHLRCLDYENVEHVCSFPSPMSTPTQSLGVYTAPKPEPWEKPASQPTEEPRT